MTRGTMRSLWRRRVNDTASDKWDDSAANDILNLGLHWVQRKIMAVDPTAFIYIDKANILANDGFIAKPQGFWYAVEVGYKDSSAPGGYRALKPSPYFLARDRSSGDDIVYSLLGRHIVLSPTPSEAVTEGVQLLYVPTLSMATDNDVPDVMIGLHDAVVNRSAIIALGEDHESVENLWKEIDRDLLDLPTYYRGSGDESDKLMLEGLGKNY